jgi:hypothetical protein
LSDGTLLLADGSSLKSNAARGGGSSIFVAGGVATYRLPARPGHFISGSECRVYRVGCERSAKGDVINPSCTATEQDCAVQTTAVASVRGTTCRPLLQTQPCDWLTQPELVGSVVQALPHGAMEGDFPLACPAGLLGSSNPAHQASASCAGLCPAGLLCPAEATLQPVPWRATGDQTRDSIIRDTANVPRSTPPLEQSSRPHVSAGILRGDTLRISLMVQRLRSTTHLRLQPMSCWKLLHRWRNEASVVSSRDILRRSRGNVPCMSSREIRSRFGCDRLPQLHSALCVHGRVHLTAALPRRHARRSERASDGWLPE